MKLIADAFKTFVEPSVMKNFVEPSVRSNKHTLLSNFGITFSQKRC